MDGNGKIDFEEFLILFKFKENQKLEAESENQKDKQLLDFFDKDKTGFLSPNEWMEVLSLLFRKKYERSLLARYY